MDPGRRELLKTILLGAGGYGLRGLLASLPAALLAAPELATGQTLDPCDAITTTNGAGGRMPQRIILITSKDGDPLNANVPGTYAPHAPLVYHPRDTPDRLPTGTFTTDRDTYRCAAVWASLPAALLDRTCFFHHATYTVAHGDHAKVNAYMGAIRRQELLVSLLARHVAGCLGCIQPQPVVLSDVLIRYAGAVLPILDRAALRDVLAVPGDAWPLALRGLRDRDLAALATTVYRPSASPAQQATLDRYVAAQVASRKTDPALPAALASPTDRTQLQQLNTAAVVLLRMNVSPVVVLRYPFGADNHRDNELYAEARDTKASVEALGDLWTKLAANGLQDDVTIVLQNVFGRTLNAANRGGDTNGRDHNAGHHCSVLVGAGFRRAVIGGLTPSGNDFRAQAFQSDSGLPSPGGDVGYADTLASLAKTLGAAVGVHRAVLDDQITSGTYVPAALVGPVT